MNLRWIVQAETEIKKMIGIVDVEVQAKFPSMPLDPMQAFVNSPSSIRLRNVPKRVGDWCIRNVQFVVTYPDGSIKTADCVLTGGIWVGTIEGTQTVGTSKSGYSIFASGTDENGNQVTGYCLGKGDVEIMETDGTLTPGKSLAYVHLLSADSVGENEGDLWRDLSGTWRIQQDGEAWLIGDDSGAIAQVSAELSAKQDALADAQIQAIDSVVDERATFVKYLDGTTSSFNIVGEISADSIPEVLNAVEVKIGDSVTSIASYAFDHCSGLSSITIGDSVASIGQAAFLSCLGLTSVTIPNSVTSIERDVFNRCKNLEEVTVGSGVASIGLYAFANTSNLSSITFRNKTLTEIQSMENYPWSLAAEDIKTLNDATQEWVEQNCVTSAQIRPFWNPLAIGVPTGAALFAQGLAYSDENQYTDQHGALQARKTYNLDATLNLEAQLAYVSYYNFVLTMFLSHIFSEPAQMLFCSGRIHRMRSGRPMQYYSGCMWRTGGLTEIGKGYAIPCSDSGIPDGRMIEFDNLGMIGNIAWVSFNASDEGSVVHNITGNSSWTVIETIDGQNQIDCTRYVSSRANEYLLKLADVNYVSSYVSSQISGKADTSYVNAQLSGKANATDLPYALSERKEWEYSGLPDGVQVVSLVWDNYVWTLTLSDGSIYQASSASEEETEVYFYWGDTVIVATKTGIYLLDHAVNAVQVTGATTVTLPALVNAGKARDFLARVTIPSGTTVAGLITFAASGNEEITFETDGDEFPEPDDVGTWLYSFTETAAHTFAVGLKQLNEVTQGGN